MKGGVTRFNEPIEPMTLGNMRANGVRSLDVSCWQCNHRVIMSADPWPETRCGIIGADVRPNWQERQAMAITADQSSGERSRQRQRFSRLCRRVIPPMPQRQRVQGGVDRHARLPKSHTCEGEHAKGAAMSFSEYNIDPEHTEAMKAAFHRVCEILQLNADADDPMTEIVVMKIVELAKAGELDPERLCIAVLANLADAPRAGAATGSPASPP
jgi:hypothetical protein